MPSKLPPVPDENRSPKGTGDLKNPKADDHQHGVHGAPDPAHQGQQGTSNVNTHHQGYQQDR